ncbi:MAG: ABC transporter permease [Eubacteriales bacterium]|nr:ABC transporter permease [Eubacteriales bacterium]
MDFINQIKIESKKIWKSKFMLVFCILALFASIAAPVVTAIAQAATDYYGGYSPYDVVYEKAVYAYDEGYYYGEDEEPITVDGVTVTYDNPFYWSLSSIIYEQEYIGTDSSLFTTPEALDLTLDLLDEELSFYVRFAKNITTYEDYRYELAWNGIYSLYDKFIYEHSDTDPDVLEEAAQYRLYLDPAVYDATYVDITAEERLKALDAANESLDALFDVVENNDFPQYIALRLQQEQDNIDSLNDQIAVQQKAIIDNPSQEDELNRYILDLQNQIEMIETDTIPTLEYRLEKNIIPYADVWQNAAIDDITNNKYNIQYTTIITKEEFNNQSYYAIQYGTYEKYVAAMNAQIDGYKNAILIAQKCLDADQPDMKYVTDGARYITVSFLGFSMFIALFAVIIGGFIIASEFQQGTIRLLMIRPKTRIKILMSKFLAALFICLGVYLAGCVINLLMNGALFGFYDFGYPNFTVSGEIGFFAYYIPKFLACSVSIIFAYSFAFMFSVLVRNSAVSISVPIVGYVVLMVLMTFLGYTAGWLAYTPIPYINISTFFAEYSTTYYMMQNGIHLDLAIGIPMLIVLSALCTFISVWVFKKRDITN